MNENILTLHKSHATFVQEYNEFKKQLKELKTLAPQDLGDFQEEFKTLNQQIFAFLESAFNKSRNEFALQYQAANVRKFNVGVNKPDDIEKNIKENIQAKIDEITHQLESISICDLIIDYSDDLFEKRQRFSIKQKKEFVLMKLHEWNLTGSKNLYAINGIYSGNGLKEDTEYEPSEIGKKLENEGLIEVFPGSTGYTCFAKITFSGIEYVQELNKDAFGLYSVGDDLTRTEREYLRKVLNELRKEVKSTIDQKFTDVEDNIKATKALNKEIDETIAIVESKLPKKIIQQTFFGKMIIRNVDKAVDFVLLEVAKGIQKRLPTIPQLVEFGSKAVEFLEKLNP
jgi:hypothetical protein